MYAICKNEEHFVDRWMDSMQEADIVIVTDTGSTDATVEKLRSRGAVVYSEEIKPWRFDAARNASLGKVPDEVDICVCTDLDEVFRPGWRRLLEDAWSPRYTMANYLYNWSLKPDGTPGVQMQYFKVHARHGYEWAFPIHECLRFIGRGSESKVFVPGMVLDHYPDSSKSRGSYLGLLETAVAEDPASDRMRYYLGREYSYFRMWDKCIDTLEAYLKLPTAVWREERCAATRLIARSYNEKRDAAQAERWYYRAIAELPTMREPYVECAQFAYEAENWPMILYMCESALAIQHRSDSYVNTVSAWDHTPHDLCSIACYRLGMYERSLRHAQDALEITPDDPRLQKNVKIIAQKLEDVKTSA